MYFCFFPDNLAWKIGVANYLNRIETQPFIQRCFMSRLAVISPVVLEKKNYFLKFEYVYLLFRYYLALEIGVVLHLQKLDQPSTKSALCQVWLKLNKCSGVEDF